MNQVLKFGIVFAGAVALGGLIGWSSVGRTPTVGPESIPPRPSRDTPRPRASREELLELARQAVESAHRPGFNRYSKELANWTDAEILVALNESLTDPHAALAGETAAGNLGSELLGEWMKRDFVGALAWFEALDSRIVKARFAGALSYRWPPDQAEQGLDFVRKNRGLFSSTGPWSIIEKALEARAKRGPAAVEELLRDLREEHFDMASGNGARFPRGFDFQTLMRGDEIGKLSESGMVGSIVRAWCETDREQAFAWVLETQGARGLASLASCPDGMTKDRLSWLGGKFQELDGAQRTEFLKPMLEFWFFQYPDGARDFAAGITDPGARLDLGQATPQLVFSGHAAQAMPLLEAIPDPAKRIQMLEAAVPDEQFTKRPDLRSFDATDEALLREKLAEWEASETQIDAIIFRFKP